MNVDEPLYLAFVRGLSPDRKHHVRPASPSLLKWLRSKSIPDDVINLFARMTPRKEIYVGAGSLHNEKDIMRINDDFPQALEAGLLMIGAGPNGDPIAIDIADGCGACGYISHEEMWGARTVRDVYIGVARSLGEFVHKMDSDENFAWDYWEARKRSKKE